MVVVLTWNPEKLRENITALKSLRAGVSEGVGGED